MLSLVVLFTVFLGLVGILALWGEWQKRHGAPPPSVPSAESSRQVVVEWVDKAVQYQPTIDQFLALLNQVAAKRELQPEDKACCVIMALSKLFQGMINTGRLLGLVRIIVAVGLTVCICSNSKYLHKVFVGLSIQSMHAPVMQLMLFKQ